MRSVRWLFAVAIFGGLYGVVYLHAQVAFDAAVDSDQASASTYTVAHTIGACANCELIVGVGFDAPFTVTSITWNGSENLSLLCRDASDSNALELWHRVGPTTGTHNVVVTPNTPATGVVQIASFSGVDQTTPANTAVCDHYTAFGSSTSHAATGATNGMGVDVFNLASGAGAITVNGGQTTRLGPTGAIYPQLLTTVAGATSMTTGYSWVNAGFYRWVHLSVGLNPVAASGGVGGLLLSGVGR